MLVAVANEVLATPPLLKTKAVQKEHRSVLQPRVKKEEDPSPQGFDPKTLMVGLMLIYFLGASEMFFCFFLMVKFLCGLES